MLRIISLLLCLTVTQVGAQSAKRMIRSIADHATEIQAVWPGFVESFNHGIYQNNGALYLLSSDAKLAGWEAKGQVGDVYLWYQKNIDLKSAKRSFFVQQPLSPGLLVDGVLESPKAIRVLFHESFHGFQETTNAPLTTNWSTVEINEKIRQIKQAEFNLLTQILTLTDQAERDKKTNVYVSLRAYREGLMGPESVALERNMEWQEGVAAYVEFRIREIIEGINLAKALVPYGARLSSRQQPQSIEKFMRFDAYFHGAAISFILNENDPGWQQKINQGKTPFELLLRSFPASALDPADVEQGLNLTADNQTIKVDRFDALQAWDAALIIEMKYLDGFSFVSKKIESKPNGTLVSRASKVHSSSEHLTLTASVKAMFLTKDEAIFKLSSLPNTFKHCERLNDHEYVCAAGTKVKIKGIKLKLKQAMTIRKSSQQLELVPTAADRVNKIRSVTG